MSLERANIERWLIFMQNLWQLPGFLKFPSSTMVNFFKIPHENTKSP